MTSCCCGTDGAASASPSARHESDAAWLDPIADLLIAADRGDVDAERSLLEQYRTDEACIPAR